MVLFATSQLRHARKFSGPLCSVTAIVLFLLAFANHAIIAVAFLHPSITTSTTKRKSYSARTHLKPPVSVSPLPFKPACVTTTTSTTQIHSILDTLSSFANISPSRPILDGKKGLLKALLADTFLGKNLDNVECCYKASRDGWSAVDFHNCVDNKGFALLVARTRTGILFGGFNPNGWRSTDDYYLSNAAFLWYATPFGAGGVKKCPIYPGSNAAVYDYATGGPCFGSDDLKIGEPKAAVMGGFTGPDMENVAVNAGNLKTGRCSFSGSYNFDNAWPVRGSFSLVEVEVYCQVYPSSTRKKSSFW